MLLNFTRKVSFVIIVEILLKQNQILTNIWMIEKKMVESDKMIISLSFKRFIIFLMVNINILFHACVCICYIVILFCFFFCIFCYNFYFKELAIVILVDISTIVFSL